MKLKYNQKVWSLTLMGLLLLYVSCYFASKGVISGPEARVFNYIYRWPDILKIIFVPITYMGSFWFAGGLAAYFYIRRQQGVCLRIVIASGLAYIVSITAKQLVARPRPEFLLAAVEPRQIMSYGYGFPSAHTAIATVLAILVAAYLPRKYWFIVPIWVLAVGVSRIYLGVHAPLDIVGGFGIGLVVASCLLLVLPASRKLNILAIAKRKT